MPLEWEPLRWPARCSLAMAQRHGAAAVDVVELTRLTLVFGWRKASLGSTTASSMVNQYVLRGSSSATPPGHERLTYRNFFPATARWQFMGIRLARDLG